MGKNTSIFNKLQREKVRAATAQKAGKLKEANRHVVVINSCRARLKTAGCNSRNTETVRQLSFVADNFSETQEYVRAKAESESQGKKTRSKTRELDAFCERFEEKLKRAGMPVNYKTLKKLLVRVEKNRSYEPKKTSRNSSFRTASAKPNIRFNELPDGRINVSADYDTRFGEFLDNEHSGKLTNTEYEEFVSLKQAGDSVFAN